MRARELARVRRFVVRPTKKLSRGRIPRLPEPDNDIIEDFLTTRVVPQCVQNILPKLGSRRYQMQSQGGVISIDVHLSELPSLVGECITFVWSTHRRRGILLSVEMGHFPGAKASPLFFKIDTMQGLFPISEARSFKLELSCDDDFLVKWFEAHGAPWPKTEVATVLDSLVRKPWCRGRCQKSRSGSGCQCSR